MLEQKRVKQPQINEKPTELTPEQVLKIAERQPDISWQRLRVLQFAYALKKHHQNEQAQTCQSSFFDLLDADTRTGFDVLRLSERRRERDPKLELKRQIYSEIERRYQKPESGQSRLESIINYVNPLFLEWDKKSAEEQFSGRVSGVIESEQMKFDEADKAYVQLHFPEPRKADRAEAMKEGESATSSYEKSLEKLAGQLIEEGKWIDYLKRDSWMADVDRSVASGFRKVSSVPFDPQAGKVVWGQFLTREGSLNPTAVAYLLKNGKPRYQRTIAKMDFMGFLQRYAPDEYRGTELVFHKESQEGRDIRHEVESIERDISNKFDSLDFDSFISWLKQGDLFAHILSQPIGEELYRALQIAKLKGEPFNQLRTTEAAQRLISRVRLLAEEFGRGKVDDIHVTIPMREPAKADNASSQRSS